MHTVFGMPMNQTTFNKLHTLDMDKFIWVEAPVSSTRGRKPKAIHNVYFDSDVYGSYDTEDLEDVCVGVIQSIGNSTSHRGAYLNWHKMSSIIIHMPTFTTNGIMQYLKLSRQQADKYMKALDVWTGLVKF